MLRHLSPANKGHLLQLFNVLHSSATVPPQWKESTVIPLLKPGNVAKDPASYRPLALTSCLCKAMEREIANRIHWFLESKHKLYKEQTGFRRGRITTDNIVQLEMTDVKLNLAVFLDISKAYDSIYS